MSHEHRDCVKVRHICPWDGSELVFSHYSPVTGERYRCDVCQQRGPQRREVYDLSHPDLAKVVADAWEKCLVIEAGGPKPGSSVAQIPWEQYLALKRALNALASAVRP